MKKGWRRWLALGLAALTAVSLAACGGSGDGEGDGGRGGEFVYVPEYVSLGGDEDTHTSRYVCADGKLYYMQYSYGSETYEESLMRYDMETKEKEKITLEQAEGIEDASQSAMTVDKDGNLCILWNRYFWDENNPENTRQDFILTKYDASGSNLFARDITDEIKGDEENSWVQNMLLDGDGRIYLLFNNLVRLYDGEGNYQGEVKTEADWVESSFTGKDGRVYIAFSSWNGDGREFQAVPIDFDGKKMGEAYHFSGGNGNVSLYPGLEKDFLMVSDNVLYECDAKSGEQEKMLNWMDCDINSDYVQMVCPASDGRLMVVLNDWSTNETEIALLTKTKASEVAEKEEIVVGTFDMSQDLQAAVVSFNKSSSEYHITVKEYYDYSGDIDYNDAIAAMNNDITSDKCPDILSLEAYGGVNVEQLAAKGVFEDLTAWLDKSDSLSKDDFLESVLRAYTYDGVLVGIPKTFQLSAVAGKTSEVGEKMGWTVQDIMEFAAAHPDAEIFEYASRSEVMNMLMIFNQDSFIDWEKGTCHFDSDEFRQMLEFVASFPEEYDWDGERESTPTRLATGKLLLYTENIYNCQSIQISAAMFNEPVTYIGYPTIDGSAGCVMQGTGVYGITAKSGHKDGAWAFIESYLTKEDDFFGGGLPANKEKLEEEIAEASKAEPVLDENGEPLLDENGNPIYQGMGGFGYDDWEYTYHPCTEEEIAQLYELIEVARPLQMGDNEVLSIIMEEAQPYYKGEKSLDEVVALIQSRISMYVGENS